MRFTQILLVLILLVIYFSNQTLAAKKFVPKTNVSQTTKKVVRSSSIPALVKYRGDKLGIYLSFSHFNGLDSVDYSFTYNSNGIAQGAGGTVRPTNNPTAQRELLFGTCSSGVCTYHHNLTNARLVLTAHYTNGRIASKAYKIKTYQ